MKDFIKSLRAGIAGGLCVFGLMLLMGTVFNNVYDKATPVGTDAPSTLDDQDRNTKAAIQERENVDHYWPLTGTQVSDVDAGEHRKVLFHAPIAATPTVAADHGDLRIKDVDGKAELHWTDEDENEIQLTSAGVIPQASVASGSFVPPGGIVSYGGATAPTGWLLCDDSAVSRTTYATLFGIIGTNYGIGDGATTFNLPDFRGRVPVGLDVGNVNLAAADTLGETGGEETHLLDGSEMPAHEHEMATWANAGVGTRVANGVSNAGNTIDTGTEGGGGAHNNLQPYNTVNYIIKI